MDSLSNLCSSIAFYGRKQGGSDSSSSLLGWLLDEVLPSESDGVSARNDAAEVIMHACLQVI